MCRRTKVFAAAQVCGVKQALESHWQIQYEETAVRNISELIPVKSVLL